MKGLVIALPDRHERVRELLETLKTNGIEPSVLEATDARDP
jgi:GR25 family glycosyltransferase involved in LPS biosynthesis